MNQINIGNHKMKIIVQRKAIRSLILRIKGPEEIVISAPYSATSQEIERFVLSRQQWLEEHIEKVVRNSERTQKDQAGKIMIYGKRVALQWVIGQGKSSLQKDRLILFIRESSDAARQKAFEDFARASLSKTVESLRGRWDRVIDDYHLPHPVIAYRKMSSRWGSCIPAKGKITMNLNLIYYPLACVDAVLWHEYVHLIVPNHSDRFYSVILHHMPDYRERHALLNGDL